jgi:3-deoxy-D-manno-octulosonate 8-phosphate phosphatase (KDO 8-P phosphatase)
VNGGDIRGRLGRVRLVAFDVDGVFTDGRFYLSDDGVETKAFHTQDGYGIRRLLAAGLEVAVISGRRSGAVERRMAELGVAHVFLGCDDKVEAFESLLQDLDIPGSLCAYAGDDVPDIPLLRRAGISIAVANAHVEVQDMCDFTTTRAGGHGAVREICDMILGARDNLADAPE